MRSKSRSRCILAAVTVLLTVTTTGPARAALDPGPAVASTEPACTQSIGPGSEFTSCLGITAALDRAPSAGETATLTVTLRADRALPAVALTVELPVELDWAKPPTGFTTGRTTSTRPERPGILPTAQTTATVALGKSVAYSLAVKAVAAGAGQIEARAKAGPHADYDVVPLTVAASGGRSAFGVPPSDGTTAPVPADAKAAERPAWLEPRTAPLAEPVTTAVAACNAHAIGSFCYRDEKSAFRHPMNVEVRLNDVNRTQLGAIVTDRNGAFDICFDATAAVGPLRITWTLENALFRVQNNATGAPFQRVTLSHPNPGAGSTVDFGPGTVTEQLDNRAVHAFDEANDAWLFVPKSANGCWDVDDTVCRQLRIRWGRTIPPVVENPPYATQYNHVANTVDLEPDEPNSNIVVLHEIGHAIMDDVYNDADVFTNCTGHAIPTVRSQQCAWTEGFADWFPLQVYRESAFRWADGSTLDLESPTWDTSNWDIGDGVEGRVAGALLDIADTSNDGIYDSYSEGFTKIWFTFTHHVDRVSPLFWNSRGLDGFDRSDAGALRAVFQNTIGYGLREVLNDGVPGIFQTPRPDNYRFDNPSASARWSVVAMAPSAEADFDLDVYDDRNMSALLSSSGFGGSTVEFVALDNNAAAAGDYYPQVRRFTGTGAYFLEWQRAPVQALPRGASRGSMGNARAVSKPMVSGTPGVPITPDFATIDLELFVMQPGRPVSRRGQAIASVGSGGRGYPRPSRSHRRPPVSTGSWSPTRTWDSVTSDSPSAERRPARPRPGSES